MNNALAFVADSKVVHVCIIIGCFFFKKKFDKIFLQFIKQCKSAFTRTHCKNFEEWTQFKAVKQKSKQRIMIHEPKNNATFMIVSHRSYMVLDVLYKYGTSKWLQTQHKLYPKE